MNDGKFNGNINCQWLWQKHIQNLAKNKTGKLKDIFWLSKIMLSQDREQNISSCFGYF